MVRNIIILIILLPYMIISFMPKKELYFLLEKNLQKQGIIISGENIDESWLGLEIQHPTVYADGASIMHSKSIDVENRFLYSDILIEKLSVAEGLPLEFSADKLTISHNLISPTKLYIDGNSSFGELAGSINIKDSNINIDIINGKDLTDIAKSIHGLEKTEKGWHYESKF